ncbi:hypothetical protein [Nostoc sp. LEGE 12450]|uniref:hypothetical protein n=1 Tax=Nostoc sp. LEGE 12450 TaxID=1828643 RepID=UPI00187F4C0E|nr:hypothetical protein [Nostoc sp. LEGE 12450]MBE8989793.1 hypothetical protein [Nostoc sp. LEGE 12450]
MQYSSDKTQTLVKWLRKIIYVIASEIKCSVRVGVASRREALRRVAIPNRKRIASFRNSWRRYRERFIRNDLDRLESYRLFFFGIIYSLEVP